MQRVTQKYRRKIRVLETGKKERVTTESGGFGIGEPILYASNVRNIVGDSANKEDCVCIRDASKYLRFALREVEGSPCAKDART